MGHIIELGNHRMQQLGSGETALSLDLRAEMSENNDGGHVGPNENRSNQQFKVVEPFRVAVKENQTDQPRVRVAIDL